jgi:hypothetical protein
MEKLSPCTQEEEKRVETFKEVARVYMSHFFSQAHSLLKRQTSIMLCIPLWPFITGCVLLFCVIVALLTLYFASSLCKVKLPRQRLAVKRKRSSSTGQVMSLDGTNPSSTATTVSTSTSTAKASTAPPPSSPANPLEEDDEWTARTLIGPLVPCPARHRQACSWMGRINNLIKHCTEGKCVQIVKARRRCDGEQALTKHLPGQIIPEAWCSSLIGDHDHQYRSVFDQAFTTAHWKPVFLIDADSVRLFPYLVMYRTANKEWIFSVRSYAMQDYRDKFKVCLKVTSPSETLNPNQSVESYHGYSFDGSLLSCMDDEQEVRASGHYLSLTDQQVKMLKAGSTLLRYFVKIVKRD